MPWKEACVMSLRAEFVQLASQEGANVRELCRRYAISSKTAYKWLKRRREGGAAALSDRSRRPHGSPHRTSPEIEALVLQLRDEHPAWGGRKLRAVLIRRELAKTPAAGTITEILRRHGRLNAAESSQHRAFTRFEHAAPNDLWQMDFKGHFGLEDRNRCHPLTVLDDHSRFNIGLRACGDQQGTTVRRELTSMFRRYGLPRRMLMDNGSPWGDDAEHPYTPLTVWLLRLNIGVSHGRPYHPQTQGKDERFHRTLKLELLSCGRFRTLADCQPRFDPWRDVYNQERPHEALEMQPPAGRYRSSERAFPESVPPLEYASDCQVRKVQMGGRFAFHGHQFRVSRAFRGYPIGLRPTLEDGRWSVRFGEHLLGEIDLRTATEPITPVRLRRPED